jgi:hypothetical protein
VTDAQSRCWKAGKRTIATAAPAAAKENGRDRLVVSGQIMDWARGKTA